MPNANVVMEKNKRGCYARYIVVLNGDDYSTYEIDDYRGPAPNARDHAMQEARHLNMGYLGRADWVDEAVCILMDDFGYTENAALDQAHEYYDEFSGFNAPEYTEPEEYVREREFGLNGEW